MNPCLVNIYDVCVEMYKLCISLTDLVISHTFLALDLRLTFGLISPLYIHR